MPYPSPQYGNCVASVPTVSASMPSKVRDAVSESENCIGDLHSVIDELYSRLETILVPEPPATPQTAGTPVGSPPCSHLTNRIEGVGSAINSARIRIRSLISRIEL